MNIAYSCNDDYISQTGISMISLFENNKSTKNIVIYLVSKEISKENFRLLNNICKNYKRKLINIPFSEIAYDLKLTSTGRHIETVYSKIFFGRIKNLNKCLYIDSDTIINGSLTNLWNTDLTGYYLAAVETLSIKKREKLNMKSKSIFFNDGVTLLNLAFCRENKLIEKSINLINKYAGNPPVLSEGILNSICQNHVKIISMRYNLMSGMFQLGIENPEYLSRITSYTEDDIKNSCKKPVIIHFLSAFYNRPWSNGCTHPLKNHFIAYKNMSPWSKKKLDNKNLTTRIKFISLLGNLISFSNVFKISRFKTQIIKHLNYFKLK